MDRLTLEMKLLKGSPIEFQNVGIIYPVTLKEIADGIGFMKYNQYLSVIALDKYDIKEQLQTTEDIEVFDFLVINALKGAEDYKKLIIESLSWIFREPIHVDEFGFFYLGKTEDQRIIHKGNFQELVGLVMQMNHIEREEDEFAELEANAANEQARKMIQRLRENKRELKKHVKNKGIDLISMLSGIAWKCSNVNIFNIWDLTIYQLYDAYYRICVVDEYNNTMRGLYAGTIDSKSVNLEEVNWTKTIKKKK
jgi:hypothetical protein